MAAGSDPLSLTLGIFAAALSLVNFLRKERLERVGLAQQLTDTIQKLVEINTDISKYRAMPPSEKVKLPERYIPLMQDQRRVYARQADFIADQIGRSIGSYQYLVIGSAFAEIDDIVRAERYFALARDTNDPIDYCMATRRYAAYLFDHGKLDLGRQWFAKAAVSVQGDLDHQIDYRADTYRRWADKERDWDELARCCELLNHAKSEYGQLEQRARREREVSRIGKMIGEVVQGGVVDAPYSGA